MVHARVIAKLLVGNLNSRELGAAILDRRSTPVGVAFDDTVRAMVNKRLKSVGLVSAVCADSNCTDGLQIADERPPRQSDSCTASGPFCRSRDRPDESSPATACATALRTSPTSWTVPATNASRLTPAPQRQGGAIPPHPGRRVPLRPYLNLRSPTQRITPHLEQLLQLPSTALCCRRPATSTTTWAYELRCCLNR